MKNIILQHWTGELDELAILSSKNIAAYAKKVGADYRLLRGNVFRENLTPPMQKLYMLDEEFDSYDYVVMLDMDVFVRKELDINIFTDVNGMGRHTPIQDQLVKKLVKLYPHLGNLNYPYWGGSIYRLDRNTRKLLRLHFNDKEMQTFSKPYHFEDEGVMHRLAVLADLKEREDLYLDGSVWNISSFEPDVANGYFIHIRTKITPSGPKRTKIENYRDLVKRGLIEE
ncbi:hypothetical protein LCGC14_0759210 [marine sediment metagenome]|uniref:Nucleotide-diphospho-sugar transferase domain-containing protein n=1 Tax=marine sediment metagenome TaxID=412755 RepID=A0A0F9Q5S8_9ZZZZ